jgi:hypothetical protein
MYVLLCTRRSLLCISYVQTTLEISQELAKSCGLLEGDCSGYVASDFVLNILGTRAFLPHNSDLGIEVR